MHQQSLVLNAGRVDILDWMWTAADVPRILPTAMRILEPAALHGYLDVLQWVAAKQLLGQAHKRAPLISTHIRVLEWADSEGLPRHVMTPLKAAETGCLSLMQ